MKILLFKGRGLISSLIRLQTRSQYSHAAAVVGGTLYEAWQGVGVRKMDYNDHYERNGVEGIDVFEVAGADDARAKAYLESMVGKGYDYWGVIRFVSRVRMPKNDKLFCSEYAFTAALEAGVRLLERISPSEVSPGLLRLSSSLKLSC